MALNSKRMQTFFNEFIISTTNFLNHFMTDCESKFFEFERKLNRIENNLVIIEAKLASVPLEQEVPSTQSASIPPKTTTEVPTKSAELPNIENLSKTDTTSSKTEDNHQPTETPQMPEQPQQPENSNMIKISESYVYKKYFKMLKFGVPEQGVKNKMFSEGLDGNLIADPNLMIEKCPEDDQVEEE